MAKKLSSFEQWSRAKARASERESAASSRLAERAQTAAIRAAERDAIRRERAAERLQSRREREQERESIKQEKAREKLAILMEKEAQIQAWQDEADEHASFMADLVSIHVLEVDFRASMTAFRERLNRRSSRSASFVKRAEPEAPVIPPFEPQSLTFSPLEATPRYLDDWPQRLRTRVALFAFLSVLMLAGPGPATGAGIAAFAGILLFARKRKAEVLLAAHEKMVQDLTVEFIEAERVRREAYDRQSDDLKVRFIKDKREYESLERERRTRFDANEAQNAAQFDANESRRTELLRRAEEGEAEALFSILVAALPVDFELDFPAGHDGATLAECSVGLVAEPAGIRIFLRLPDDSIVPAKAITMTPDGKKQKTAVIPQSQRNSLYIEFAHSLCLAYGAVAFDVCPVLGKVTVEGAIETSDPATGQPADHQLVSFTATRDELTSLHLDSVLPEAFIEAVGGKTSVPTKRSKIVPLSVPSANICWLDEGSDTLMLPFGLVEGEEDWQWTNPDA